MARHPLSTFPYVRVRIACGYCNRSGSYRLARLAAKYGAEIEMDDLLRKLAGDCPWLNERPRPSKLGCGARFIDLDPPPRPPDLPPVMLRPRLVKR